MRISQLVFKDIGPFEEATFDFPEPKSPGELVLFEGPNGSGKTTVVEAIAVVAGDPSLGLPTLAPVASLDQRYRSTTGAIKATVSGSGKTLHVDLDPAHGGSRSRYQILQGQPWTKVSWAAFAFGGHQNSANLATDGPKTISPSPLAGALSFGRSDPASDHFGQLLTNLENERTKALTYARERAEQSKKEELERSAASRKEAIRRFERVLSGVLERGVAIEFSIDQQAPRIRFDGEEIPLDLLGEGMRSTLSWVSNLLVRLERTPWEDTTRSPLDQDFWLILDEIDESLHPTMQARVLPALRRLLPNARIYATTHSPFVVASVGEGTVFSIRPGSDHRVRGNVLARQLEPGQSLELVTSEIFDAPSEFVDTDTQEKLARHEEDVRSLTEQREIDWGAFVARRAELMKRNDEVRTAVSMQELPVRQEVNRKLREQESEGSS